MSELQRLCPCAGPIASQGSASAPSPLDSAFSAGFRFQGLGLLLRQDSALEGQLRLCMVEVCTTAGGGRVNRPRGP